MGNTFGRLLRLHTFGESHGAAMGGVIDGLPPGIRLAFDRVDAQLARRSPATAMGSGRREPDSVEILSGLEDGVTLGTPLAFVIRNRDAQPADYDATAEVWRPSHGDYTTQAKYGIRPRSGGGRVSARETVARVAAGAIAEQILPDVKIVAWVDALGGVQSQRSEAVVERDAVDRSPTRCPDDSAAQEMMAAIEKAREEGDTLGGVIRCVARNVPPGLGEPVFDKLEAELAHALMSIPAVKGFEIGSGFAGSSLAGSEHNDAFEAVGQAVRTRTNHSGGIQAGISNGMPIELAVAFKPVASIRKPQQTIDVQGRETTLQVAGRHDACVVPRAVPIVEAMVALVLADHFLRWRGQCGRAPNL